MNKRKTIIGKFSGLGRIAISVIGMVVFTQSVFASGAYVPTGMPQSKNQYNEGKMLFHKQMSFSKFATCVDCYKTKRSSEACGVVQQCVADTVTNEQINAISYFIKKRYRVQ